MPGVDHISQYYGAGFYLLLANNNRIMDASGISLFQLSFEALVAWSHYDTDARLS